MFKMKLRVCGEGFITDLNSNVFYGAFAWAAIIVGGAASDIAYKALHETTFSCALTDDLEVMKFDVFEVNKATIGRSADRDNEVSIIKYWSTPLKSINGKSNDYRREREDITVLCETSIDEKEFKSLVEFMLVNGLGKRRTHGFGQFKLVELSTIAIEADKLVESSKVKILGNLIPDDMASISGDYKVQSIQGRCNDGSTREKIVVVMPGSVLNMSGLKINNDGTIGKLLECKNDSGETYYINGKVIVKPA